MTPTASPTVAMVVDPSTLVLGVGIGTFVIFFFFIVLFFIWVFSSPCSNVYKLSWRGVSTAIYFAIVLSLIFADRKPQSDNVSTTTNTDEFIGARVAIGVVMIIFTIPACAGLFFHFSRKEEMSNLSREFHDLWQN